MQTISEFDPQKNYVWLDEAGNAEPVEVTKDFWPDLISGRSKAAKYLMAQFDMTKNTHWEMHPNGEEVFFLISGVLDCILKKADSDEHCVHLTAGNSLIIPKGYWHRLEVIEPCRLLAITAGEGTQTKPLEV